MKAKTKELEYLERLDRIVDEVHELIQKDLERTHEEWVEYFRPGIEQRRRRYEGWPEAFSPNDIEIA